MTDQYQLIATLLERVRGRWRRLVAYRATVRAALLAVAVLVSFELAVRVSVRTPLPLVTLAAVALILVIVGVVRALLPLREAPSDKQIARFIEERKTELDERLVSAVSVAGQEQARPRLAAS